MNERRSDEREDAASIEEVGSIEAGSIEAGPTSREATEPPFDDDEAPLTADELAAAERLRHALSAAGGRRARRGELPGDVHARLLAAALGEDTVDLRGDGASADLPLLDVEASADERREAERLRARLGEGLHRDPDAEPDDPIEALVEVAAALRSANEPRPLDEVAAARALARASLGRRQAASGWGRARLGWGLALAAAAAAAIVILPRTGLVGGVDATASLVPARSTQSLFDPAEPFPREGGTSDRIDRIAASRRADLRQNRFARWGIR